MDKIMDSFGIFDYTEDANGTYEYTAAEMRAYFAALVGNGVLKGAGDQFNASASGLQVTIGTGIGWLLGARGELTAQAIFTIDPVSSGMSKICSIVLDLDTVNQLIGISVLSGTQATSPSAPQLSTTEQRYQKLLWSATVHDDGTITLSDARTYVSRPGDGVSAADIGAVSFKVAQTLTDAEKALVRTDIGAAGLNESAKVLPEQASVETATQTDSYTLILADAGRRVKFTNTSAATLTIPTYASVAFAAGTEILITRYGAGAVTIAGASGVTLHSMNEARNIAEQYVTILLKKEATNEWSLWGYLA